MMIPHTLRRIALNGICRVNKPFEQQNVSFCCALEHAGNPGRHRRSEPVEARQLLETVGRAAAYSLIALLIARHFRVIRKRRAAFHEVGSPVAVFEAASPLGPQRLIAVLFVKIRRRRRLQCTVAVKRVIWSPRFRNLTHESRSPTIQPANRGTFLVSTRDYTATPPKMMRTRSLETFGW